MKKNRMILWVMAVVVCAICACNTQKRSETETNVAAGYEVFSFKDSCKHAFVTMSLELPMGNDSAALQIRDSLIADFIRHAKCIYEEEEKQKLKPYSGDKTDFQALVDYYGKINYDIVLKRVEENYQYYLNQLEEDTTLTAEQKQSYREDFTQWSYEQKIEKITESDDFAVFNSETYTYWGGAHGSIDGSGALTFNKHNGKRIMRFIKPDAEEAMQPLIRKGLREYFSEADKDIPDDELPEHLIIDSPSIPLPTNTAFPNAAGDSLVFTYCEYEIGCYAEGMPSFKLPVKDLLPYLTDAAKELLEK